MKPKVAIDMDGVTCDFVPAICKEYNIITNNGQLKPEDITDWDMRKFGVTDEMWIKPGFFRNLKPIKGAIEILWKYRNQYEFVIATDTMGIDFVQKEKGQWLDEHLPFIQKVIYTSDKSFLPTIALLDDAPHHLDSFPNIKIKMKHPYNKHVKADYEVNDWRDVDMLFSKGL